jgi:hypothetical protein
MSFLHWEFRCPFSGASFLHFHGSVRTANRFLSPAIAAAIVLTLTPAPAAEAQLPPRVDEVKVIGAERTRPATIVDLAGLSANELLTPRERTRAERRLRQLPIARSAALRYVPVRDGAAEVRAIVHERPLLPLDWSDWSGIGVRAILKDELKVDVGGPARLGEVWTASWRWAEHRPRVAVGVALPAPGAMPGVVAVDALFEEQTYVSAPTTAADALFRERRQRAGVSVSDWVTSDVRWRAGAAIDRIAGRRYLAVEGALDLRLVEDLLAPGVSFGTWRPLGDATPFSVADVSLAWRANRSDLPPFSGLVGVTLATDGSPLAVWPAAGTGGSGRGALLRAHPLHEHGVVTSENFARRLMYFTIEHQRPIDIGPSGKTAVVAFLDAGRAWGGLPGRPRRVNVDIGSGLRFASGTGTVRLDVAFGLRDQQWAVSAGWVDAWPWR